MMLHCWCRLSGLFALVSLVQSFSTTHIYLQLRQRRQYTCAYPSSRRDGRLASLPPILESLVADTLDSDRKIVVVTGGVLSGIGKGVTASSIGVVSRHLGSWNTILPYETKYTYLF